MYQSVPQRDCGLLPRSSHDELARQLFARDFRRFVLLDLPRETRKVYEHGVRPGLEAAAPLTPGEHQRVREAMWEQGYLRTAEGLQRISQELMWNSIVPVVERDADRINADVTAAAAGSGAGSLELDPSVEVPAYLTAVDIHCMPGNYHTEHAPGDASQGALFDRGSFLYALGGMGELNDATGQNLVQYIKSQYPGLAPRRILDLGCTIGHNTLPLCDAFPEAEVHAIDVAAPMLRYAHARAQALGRSVHWHQRDARNLGFPDGHFDLVVSVILFHEVAPDQIGPVFREAHRVLAPGGVMAHLDIPDYFRYPDPLFVAMVHADTFHNNEPFWGEMYRHDLQALMVDAGFPADETFRGVAPMGQFPWSVFGARKSSSGGRA